MALQIKIQGGTPTSGKGLCHTCKYAAIVRGQNCEEQITCQAGMFPRNGYNGSVRFRVSECGRYHPSNMPFLHEMEQMAWIIEARRRGPKGFEQPDGPMEVVVRKPSEHQGQQGPPQAPVIGS